ncbi:hypothetical protein [Chitinivibrio alkaliphilus]|uniref:Flagellar protein FliT n=1 Tax=Chitinivibrio alkaliphilus ACht1 TaxID=1313304 RepID=U7D5T5_9BACT|nr:hypothetical protein [Chitinivibrio alkaliphilus]ERP31854.1 hypothetical protein CALK_1305 [Chitinivibrio alkaliphilus ACht1]
MTADDLIKQIYKKTRLMVSSLDDEDVALFNTTVEERGELIQKYETLSQKSASTPAVSTESQQLLRKIQQEDVRCHQIYERLYEKYSREYSSILEDIHTLSRKKNASRTYLAKPQAGSLFDQRH